MRKIITGIALMAAVMGNASANTVSDFSFTGSFKGDDDVQLFNFTAGGSSAVTL